MKKLLLILALVVVLGVLSVAITSADGKGAQVWEGPTLYFYTGYLGLPFDFLPSDYTHAVLTPSGNTKLTMHWQTPYPYDGQVRQYETERCDEGFYLTSGQFPPSPMEGYWVYSPDDSEITIVCHNIKSH